LILIQQKAPDFAQVLFFWISYRRPAGAGGELTGGETITTGLTEEFAGGGTTLAGAPCAFEVTVVLWLP
jgi:hypothetical protein